MLDAVMLSATALAVTIMRKETLILHAGSPGLRDKLIAEFRECIDAATARKTHHISFQPVLTHHIHQSSRQLKTQRPRRRFLPSTRQRASRGHLSVRSIGLRHSRREKHPPHAPVVA